MKGENCRQLRLLFPLSFIGQFVHPVAEEVMSKEVEWKGIFLARYGFLSENMKICRNIQVIIDHCIVAMICTLSQSNGIILSNY